MRNELKPTSIYKELLGIIKPFWFNIAVTIYVAIYASFAFTFMPYLIRTIIDKVTSFSGGNLFNVVGKYVILYVCVQFGLTFTFRLYDYFTSIRMIPAMRAHITNVCMNLLFKQSHTYFQNNLSGNIANKISDLVTSIPELIQVVLDRFLFLTILILFSMITLSTVNVHFALLMLVWVMSFVLFAAYKAPKITGFAKNWAEKGSRIVGRNVDIFANFLSIQLFSAKQHEKNGVDRLVDEAVKAERELQWQYFYIFVFYGVSAVLLSIATFYLLITGTQAGTISAGDFALVLMINITIMDQLWMLAQDFAQFSKFTGRIMQAFSLILEQPDLLDLPNAKELTVRHGTINYDHVHFNYKGHDAVFKDKSLTIPAGQKIGLVGFSGGGKTTFVNLILRLYDVTQGKILIDGQDIKEVTQDSLHSAIGMIPQDPYLFHRTLMENIRFARPDATDAEVRDAAKRAHADEFINKMPLGYQSVVGERGIKLSGGQRQRIAIARAMLKNAPLLILDEATSQLDSITEEYIQKSLWELMQGKTTIVVAHRLSTLMNMDRILAFDQGSIVEEGTHAELLAKNGLYKSLWEAQVGGFLPSDPNDAIIRHPTQAD